MLAVALLAAGRARRMRGRDKLLEPLEGTPLLRCLAERILAAGTASLAVTLPPDDRERAEALKGLALVQLSVPDAEEGMAASIRAAARWALSLHADGLMICPADMPELTSGDFAVLSAAFRKEGPPLRATASDGKPGHPVVFPALLLSDLLAVSGDQGARSLLLAHPPQSVALPAKHATTDLDTPEDWQRWRSCPDVPSTPP